MARINGGVPQKLRRCIISPDNLYYRIWCYMLTILATYTCFVSLTQWSFIQPQARSFFIVDNIINFLFLIDMIATFFVAYVDGNTCMMVDNPKNIAIKYSKTIIFDIFLWFPFELVGLTFHTSGRTHKILNSLRFFRLIRFYRVYSWYLNLEKSDKINFTCMRTAMLIMMTCFVAHCGACIFYYAATLNSDPQGTWIGSLEEKWWKSYVISIYWAIVTLTTVGYGDWHAKTLGEMAVSIVFLCINLLVASYITSYITNWMSPGMGKLEEYKEHRSVAASFCDRNCIPTPLRQDIFSHLRLQHTTEMHGFHYYKDHQFLQSLPRGIRTSILQLLCHKISDSHLFEEVSTETQFQMVAGTIKIGNFVGESCVFTNKPQMFTIKTTQISQLAKIDRDNFLKILEGSPSDGAIMLENHIKLLKLLDDHYLNRVLKTLEYQMAIGRMNVPLAVWFAAERDYGQLFYRLLRKEDPNEPDNKGRTPLHILASRGDILKVRRLCEYGADPNITDLDGNTVLHVAVIANKIDIVRCLLEHGATGNTKNTGGFTPIQLATSPSQKDIQNLLSMNETTKS